MESIQQESQAKEDLLVTLKRHCEEAKRWVDVYLCHCNGAN